MYTVWVHYEYWDREVKSVLPSWRVVHIDYPINSAVALQKVAELITKDQSYDSSSIVIDDWKILNANIIQESRY